jgi:hypothetical protein
LDELQQHLPKQVFHHLQFNCQFWFIGIVCFEPPFHFFWFVFQIWFDSFIYFIDKGFFEFGCNDTVGGDVACCFSDITEMTFICLIFEPMKVFLFLEGSYCC